MSEVKRATVSLDLDVRDVARARRFITATLADWGHIEVAPEATFLASETVTNAVKYGDEPVQLELDQFDLVIRISVTDAAPTMPQSAGLPPPEAVGGRGIALVRAMAQDFGIDRIEDDGKRVWFELPVPNGIAAEA